MKWVFSGVTKMKKAARAMAPEPPPTQPYYERRVALTSAATLLRRYRRGYLHQTDTSALTVPSHVREWWRRDDFDPISDRSVPFDTFPVLISANSPPLAGH